MKKISRYPLRFLVAFYIVIVFVSVFVSRKSFLVFAGPPASGDWIVTGTESHYDEVIVLNGNLIVEDGGNLTFRKVTLKMNCTYNGQYNITVRGGGIFYVLEGSVITSANPDKRIGFFDVHQGSTLRMNNSELHECGGLDPNLVPSGLEIHSDAIVENSLFSRNMWSIRVERGEVIVRNNNITANDQPGIHVGAHASPTIYDNYISLNNGSGIMVRGSPIIYNNTITFNNAAGIEVGEGSPIIYNNTITSNPEAGITLWNGINSVMNDNIIMKNGIGITASNSSSTVSGNIIAENQGGIVSNFVSSSTIANNTITSNIGPGIICFNHSDAIIQGNTITNTTGGDAIGLNLYCTGIIQGNLITDNHDGQGISVVVHSNPLIQGNIITSNKGGVHCNNDSLPEIHWNDVYGNEDHGVQNADPSVTVNATYNYWGDGPSTSSHVLYDPWLTESIVFPKITSPLSSETVSSTVTVSTKVYAQSGVHKVEFYIDDRLEYTDYDSSYEWNWNTTQYTETEHNITVKAYDMFGLKTSTSIAVFVDNTPPTVSIKEPTSENIYSGMINIRVNATDNQELSTVHFRVENTEWLVMTYDPTDLLWKYDLNTTTLSDGQHTLMVLALDRASNPATTSTATHTDNTPPTLTIQSPQSGMTVGGTSLIIDVQANDGSGISKIEFYLQDVLVYTATGTPYQWSWDTTKHPNGEYTITAKAYDNIGRVNTSETTVTVKNVESPWWQTHFWTIIQALIALGGLTLGILTYLQRKEKKKKKKKTRA